MGTRQVVACLVTHGNEVCLVRRSLLVDWDRSLWHCVTGYLDAGVSPRKAAECELAEELGLSPDDARLDEGPVMRFPEKGVTWVVHTFRVTTHRREMRLNWENDAYVWLRFEDRPPNRVPWLDELHRAVDRSRRPATA